MQSVVEWEVKEGGRREGEGGREGKEGRKGWGRKVRRKGRKQAYRECHK